jgi:hypothetical protein
MTFKEILDQAIALLQRRGRLTAPARPHWPLCCYEIPLG